MLGFTGSFEGPIDVMLGKSYLQVAAALPKCAVRCPTVVSGRRLRRLRQHPRLNGRSDETSRGINDKSSGVRPAAALAAAIGQRGRDGVFQLSLHGLS
jgi:hypothetical protein